LHRFTFLAAIVLLLWQALAAFSFSQIPSNEEIFRRGTDALARADYPAAERAFLTVLKTEPRNMGALGNLGVVYARTHRSAKAIGVYERALNLAPRDQRLLVNLGLAYFKQEQYGRALPAFKQVEALDPTNWQARELAASCRLFSGELPEAIRQLEQLRTVDPNKSGVLYLLGVAYTRAREPQKAKAIFAELLSSAVDPAQASLLLGRISYEGGRFSEAETSLLAALERDPNLPGARLELAKVYISQRQNAKALALLRALVSANPEDADAQYFLGALLATEQNFAASLQPLEAARKGLPDSWAVFYYLGKARFKLGDPRQAIPLLEHSAELNSAEESVYYLLGQAYRAAGRSADARSALARVRELQAAALHKEAIVAEHIPGTQPVTQPVTQPATAR
jgi:tetratricopeptide (TPR) repeat protein